MYYNGISITSKRNHRIIILLTYILLFFIAQATYAYINSHTMLGSNYLLQAGIRFSIWTVPMFVFLVIEKKNPFEYLKLNKNILNGMFWGLTIGFIIILYNIVSVYLLYKHVNFTFYIGESTWLRDVFVIIKGAFQPFYVLMMFSEELLFRGFFLQKIQELSTFWIGNFVNAFLFVLIHFIGWIIQGQSILNFGFGIFIFALITGIALRKTNSIWSCVLIHIFNNFISTSIIF